MNRKTAIDATASWTELAGLRRGSRVRVVYPEAWVQTLELNAQRVQGVSEETLASLLAYEAETYTGLSPERSVTAFVRVAVKGGVSQFLTMQISLDELAEIRGRVKAAGLVLAGVTHPDLLAAGDGKTMIVPPPEPKTLRDHANAAMAALLVAGALCGAVSWALSQANSRLETRVRAVEEARDRCASVERAAQAARSEKASLVRRYEDEISKPLRLLRARRSYSRILDALAETCPKGGMVSTISSEGDYTLGITGVTTTNEEAESFLKNLGDRLRSGGFGVATLSLTSMNQLPDGGPWSFRCRIQPLPGEVMP